MANGSSETTDAEGQLSAVGTSQWSSFLEDVGRSEAPAVPTMAPPPILTMPLTALEGNHYRFNKLHGELLGLDGDTEGLVEVLKEAHQILTSCGLNDPQKLGDAIVDYLRGGHMLQYAVLPALQNLDVRLLGMRSILLEDLTPAVLARWLADPTMFADVHQVAEVRKELYDESRLPVLARPPEPLDMQVFEISQRRRQLVIERETQKAAVAEFLQEQEKLETSGRASAEKPKKKMWMTWVDDMAQHIRDIRSGKISVSGRGSKGTRLIRDEDLLEPELMAVVTAQTVLNLLFLPKNRRKDDIAEAASKKPYVVKGGGGNPGDIQVLFVEVVCAIGDAVALESSWRQQDGHMGAKMAKDFQVRSFSRTTLEERKEKIVPLGAALLDMLLKTAVVQVPTEQLDPAELAKLSGETKDGMVTFPALCHSLQREGAKKTKGYLVLPKRTQDVANLDMEDFMNFIAPKHQPMVIPPQPWLPSERQAEGAYLMHRCEFVRTRNQQSAQLRMYCPQMVKRVMDGVGCLPWRINQQVLKVIGEVQERDLQLAGVPPRDDPIIPDFQEIKGLPRDDRRKIDYDNAIKKKQELASERPSFMMKLRVAKDFVNAPRIYFPHNVDFRGRAYPVPPHLNHIGDDTCRGLLEFAEGKALGEEGFYWLKMGLANLLGDDKAPFKDRQDWVTERKEKILAVARDPLAPEHVDFWSATKEGPWQALARIFEIAAVWESGDEKGFLSRQATHLDGSCNGLQHYAALGRDKEGGYAVNLGPSTREDRPSDVYRVVLEKVKANIRAEAAKEIPEAQPSEDGRPQRASTVEQAQRLLELNVLQRKTVKQTVMTICYGVTAIGAREQVKRQLEALVGNDISKEEISALSGYLSSTILKSIGEVFCQAMQIKKWFDEVSKVCNDAESATNWISPVGLVCSQPYKQVRKIQVMTSRQKITMADDDGPKVHKIKQRMGFPPNFIHSVDASHMMLAADACHKQGLSFAGVHDSFWTHAADAPRLNKIIREEFINLHSRPILEDFRRDMSLHVGSDKLPELPKQGELDLNLVRESTYVFN